MADQSDLYSGFGQEIDEILDAESAQQASLLRPGSVGRGLAARPGSALRGSPSLQGVPRPGTSVRLGTAQTAPGMAWPLTADKAAGFTSNRSGSESAFKSPTLGLAVSVEQTAQQKTQEAQAKATLILEESLAAHAAGDLQQALELAKDAGRKERAAFRARQQLGFEDGSETGLTLAVCLNLAEMYAANQLWTEALSTYGLLLRNKIFSQVAVHMGMGNCCLAAGNHAGALKSYRLALDLVPPGEVAQRMAAQANIGLVFAQQGLYEDAAQVLLGVMAGAPTHQVGHNLVVCAYALVDADLLKKSFQLLVELPLAFEEEPESLNLVFEQQPPPDDELTAELRHQRAEASRLTSTAARLVAPALYEAGDLGAFDWCSQTLAGAGYDVAAGQVLLAKAGLMLQGHDMDAAQSALKVLEGRGPEGRAAAAANLAYVCGIRGELDEADHYVDFALSNNRYSGPVHVTRGNIALAQGRREDALACYQDALQADPSCMAAAYNTGLVSKQLGELKTAAKAFQKVAIARGNADPAALCQLASVAELAGDFQAAAEWLAKVSTILPGDSGVLVRLGSLAVASGDDHEALQCYLDAHAIAPADVDTIAWIGAYYVQREEYASAAPWFLKADALRGSDPKWGLMTASCFRRIGSNEQALAMYEDVHARHPQNLECLRYLGKLHTAVGNEALAKKYAAVE